MTSNTHVTQAEWNAALAEVRHDPNCSAVLDTGGPLLSCDCDRDYRAASLIVTRRLAAHRQSSSNAAERGRVDELHRLLDNVGGFLDDFAQADLDEGAADAVTVGMVYQQQTQTVVLPRIRAALASLSTPTAEPIRQNRLQKYLVDEAQARERLATFPETVRQRLARWQEGQSEWFGCTVLEIVAEFIAFDDAALTTPPTPDRIGKDAMREAVIFDIATERQRQIDKEGWTPKHDDEHADGSLAAAAATYAFSAATADRFLALDPIGFWPWAAEWWKPSTPRRDLIKAGALIIAEIERIDRATALPQMIVRNPGAKPTPLDDAALSATPAQTDPIARIASDLAAGLTESQRND